MRMVCAFVFVEYYIKYSKSVETGFSLCIRSTLGGFILSVGNVIWIVFVWPDAERALKQI